MPAAALAEDAFVDVDVDVDVDSFKLRRLPQ
eukprot:COSAG02_NODE_22240_length_758_cov_3.405159_1_plen_30_part_10